MSSELKDFLDIAAKLGLPSLATILLAASCLAVPQVDRGKPMDTNQARAAFESSWRGAIRDGADRARWEQLDRLVRAGPSGVSSLACRDLLATVQRTEGPGRLPESFLGSLAALDRGGACWKVSYDGRLRAGLAAAVAPDGEVLFVWVVPEG
jgi:hypothetical protein